MPAVDHVRCGCASPRYESLRAADQRGKGGVTATLLLHEASRNCMTSWSISRSSFYLRLYIVLVVYVSSASYARHLGNQLYVRTRSLGTENIDIGRLCDSAKWQRTLALVRVVTQVRSLAVAAVLTLAGVGACFSEASQELMEEGMHSRHTSDNGE
jgi:cobalamin synthase